MPCDVIVRLMYNDVIVRLMPSDVIVRIMPSDVIVSLAGVLRADVARWLNGCHYFMRIVSLDSCLQADDNINSFRL